MLLTFLNLVVVTGILVGLVVGINNGYREQYTGDVIVSPLDENDYIERSPHILALIRSLPQVESMTARYVANATVEAEIGRASCRERV